MAKRRNKIALRKMYPDGNFLKWKIIGYTLLAAGVGTAGYMGYRYYKNHKQNRAQKASLETGDPANLALRLKKAFDNDGWPGTNEEEVYKVMKEISSKAFYQKVMKAYKDLTGNELNHDLDDELDLDELSTVQEILSNKPDKLT